MKVDQILFRVLNLLFLLFLLSLEGCTQSDLPLKGYFSDWQVGTEETFGIQGDIASIDISLKSVLYFELGGLDYGYSEVPRKLDSLVNLKELSCIHNFFDRMPCGLNVFKTLHTVNFSWNPLKTIPYCINEYKNLRILKLVHTEIDSVPQDICQLEKLEEIYLGNSGVHFIPNCLANLPNLKLIDLKCDWLPEDKNIELLESDREILRFSKEERKQLRELMPHVRIIFGDDFD